MSEIKVHVLTADARAERTVTTGTKAWELFTETPDVIAARVSTRSTTDSKLRDLAYELAETAYQKSAEGSAYYLRCGAARRTTRAPRCAPRTSSQPQPVAPVSEPGPRPRATG